MQFFDGFGDLGTSFEQTYRCYPASFIDKPQNENGDKIIMPPSANERLASLHIDYPMLFELRNAATERISHCGVLEFIAEEGMIYMPYWMMENLLLQEGDNVQVKNVTLPKGTYVKLQPDTKDLLDISNPKAILETMLRNFSCLTTGDSIMVAYDNKKYYIDIIETKPSNAITIIETDCEVDFAPPIDYKEHQKPVATVPSTNALAKGLVCADKAMSTSSPPFVATFKGKENFFNSPEEAASLDDLIRETGVEQLLAKLEAPPAQSSFLSSASSNDAAIHIQKGLMLSLQSSSDVDNMIVIANGVFNVLRNLNIDFSTFYDKVKMFIGCSALKVQLANFSEESSSHKELEAQYQRKKFNFDEFSGYLKDLCASLAKKDDRIADLDQKIAQTKDLLKQLENELSSVQAERTYFTNNLAQVSENVSKSENEVQAALEALTQYKNKCSYQEIVKQAFDRVKASLDE